MEVADDRIVGHEWEGDFDPFEDEAEKRMIYSVLDSFRQYRRAGHLNDTHRRRQNFYTLPSSQWMMLAGPPFNFLEKLEAVDDAIDANAEIAEAILRSALESFGFPSDLEAIEEADVKSPWYGTATHDDIEKARSTVRQFWRDWSSEGEDERFSAFRPIFLALQQFLEDDDDRCSKTILVPGAGLGRLVYELVSIGYTVEGNEISYHQLFASSWVLNHVPQDTKFDLYPWATSFSNQLSRAKQLEKVSIPDVHPGSTLQEASVKYPVHAFDRMSMTASDFCVTYKTEEHKNRFDVVICCFFIDTAPNFLAYIETVKNCLKPGGLWINYGPLLWHFENNAPGSKEQNSKDAIAPKHGQYHAAHQQDQGIGEAGSFELTDDEVVQLVEHYGFTFEVRNQAENRSTYISNPNSMLQNIYMASFWVARKKE